MAIKCMRRRAAEETVTVSVRVGRELQERLNAVRDEAAKHGFVLDLPAAMADALKKFAKQAEKELATFKKEIEPG